MSDIVMNPTRDTIKKFKKTISDYRMLAPGDLCIVAVSGGPDSVCLLHILYELRQELEIGLVVAHFNHGLRGTEDEAETQFVREIASSMALPFETEKASSLLEGGPSSIEERARNARYAFLEKLRDRLHAQKIAIGHHLDDQAETVLMRLLRGSGPSGLTGIPPCRGNTIIRPLIDLKREDIESYLKARNLPYVTDSSNLQTNYLRNKIRLELLPLLHEYQPRLTEHLGQLAHILRGENEYLEDQAEDWVVRHTEENGKGDFLIPIGPLTDLPSPIRNRVVRHLLKKAGKNLRSIDRGHIESVVMLAKSRNSQGTLNLPNGLAVKRIYDKLAFTAGETERPREFHYQLDGLGTYDLEAIGRSITLVEMERDVDLNVQDHQWTAYLDADKIQYPLILRNFEPGDRFVPLGMRGHKKVKDFFIDLKIPSEARAMTPLLLSRDALVWVCGLRIDDRFKVTSKTKRILKITIT